MGRRKLALQLIPEEKSRKLTYERRKKGLMKKAQELSALCGVDTCVLVYDSCSCSNRMMAQPETWPLNHGEVRRVIERYRSGCTQMRAKRSSGLHEFFENKKRKVKLELEKVRKHTWEAKFNVSDELLTSLSGNDLRDILSSLQRKLDAAKDRLAYLKEIEKGNDDPSDSTIVLPVPSPMTSDSLGNLPLPHSNHMQGDSPGDSLGNLPLPHSYHMKGDSLGNLPLPHSYGIQSDSLGNLPLPHSSGMLGNSLGNLPLPHSYCMRGDSLGNLPLHHSYHMQGDSLGNLPLHHSYWMHGDSLGNLPLPHSYSMQGESFAYLPSPPHIQGESFAYLPSPPHIQGESFAYLPLPHSNSMQLLQQGTVVHSQESNPGCCAGSRLPCSDKDDGEEDGICEDWMVLNPVVHEDERRHPWQLFEGSEEDYSGFFLPGLLDEDEPSMDELLSF